MIIGGTILGAQNSDTGKRTLAVSGEVALGKNPVTRSLHFDHKTRAEVEHRRAGARVYLVLQGLVADRPPGITYDLFLDLPAGEHGRAMEKYFVGSLNFYEIRNRSFLSFDITDRVHKLSDWDGMFEVTFVPDGNLASDSHIHIDRIAVVLLGHNP
jgi:hypothetical protein